MRGFILAEPRCAESGRARNLWSECHAAAHERGLSLNLVEPISHATLQYKAAALVGISGLRYGASIRVLQTFQLVAYKNRERLLEGDIARGLLRTFLAGPTATRRPLTEHFSADSAAIEARASTRSFRPKDDGDEPPGL